MELNNGFFLFLFLALSSLFSLSANATCVPRNNSQIQSTVGSLVASSPAPPQSPPQSPAQSPAQSPIAPPQSQPTQQPSATEDSLETTTLDVMKSIGGHTTFDTVGLPPATPMFTRTTTAWEGTDPTDLSKICGVTSDPHLCTQSISSHLDGAKKIDPVSALKTEIQESIKEVEKVVVKVKALRKDPTSSNAAIACFDTCLENFDLAIYDLNAGLKSIDALDAGTLETVLTAVSTNLMTCDDTFAEMGVDSPLDNLTSKMDNFASNCLAISKLIL